MSTAVFLTFLFLLFYFKFHRWRLWSLPKLHFSLYLFLLLNEMFINPNGQYLSHYISRLEDVSLFLVMDGGGLPSGHWQRTLCFRSNQTSLSKMKTDPCAAYRKPSGTLTCHLPCVCGRCPAGYSCRSFRTCLLENVDMAFTKFQTQSVFVGLVLKYTMRWLQAA